MNIEKAFKTVETRFRGNWLQFNCPFCGDTGFHGAVHVESGAASCFKCGKLSLYEVCGKLKIPYPAKARAIRKAPDEHKPIKQPINLLDTPEKIHKTYLKERNYDHSWLIERFKIKFTNHLSNYPNRIIIPIEDVWQGRSCAGAVPKYIFPECNIGQYLFNEQDCATICLCEGVFDVFRLESFGISACAVMGRRFSKRQYGKLAKYKQIIFAMDNEPETHSLCDNAMRTLKSLGVSCKKLKYNGKDIDESWKHMNATHAMRIYRSTCTQ